MAWRWNIGAVAALAAAGCSLVGGLADYTIEDAPATKTTGAGGQSSASSSHASSSSANSTTGAGGMAQMCQPSKCPQPASSCAYAVCIDQKGEQSCDTAVKALGTDCESGHHCDGQGNCVECNKDADCTPPNECNADSHLCVSPSCSNNTKDPGETDTDCGGPKCKPCAIGQTCATGTDCLTGKCTGDKCVCFDQAQCLNGKYCASNGQCLDKKSAPTPCSQGYECKSGNCVWGLCSPI